MRRFTLIWLGQLLSQVGTGMTQFAITIWAWQETGQATALALVGFFTFTPAVLLSPLAGALVDRVDRRRVLVISDLAAGLASLAILLLQATGRLEVWHLYVTGAFSGAFSAFQFPAWSAAVTTLVAKRQYARAAGMLSLAQSASGVAAPILAGAMIGPIGLTGILSIDLISFVFAVATLLAVRIPAPSAREIAESSQGSLYADSVYGFRYIVERKSLLGLQLVFFFTNLTATFGLVLLPPTILARSGEDTLVLGTVQSVLGFGGLAGGLLLATWGGPRRRVKGVLGGMALGGLGGLAVLGLGRSLPVWSLGAFMTTLAIPIINGSNQAIWQAKVPSAVQGRVFAARRVIAQITAPLAMLLAGPLADRVFEPAMQPGGALAGWLPWLGPGPGAGMGLMLIASGLVGLLVAIAGWLTPAVRDAEDLLPDAHPDEEEAEEHGAEPAGDRRGVPTITSGLGGSSPSPSDALTAQDPPLAAGPSSWPPVRSPARWMPLTGRAAQRALEEWGRSAKKLGQGEQDDSADGGGDDRTPNAATDRYS